MMKSELFLLLLVLLNVSARTISSYSSKPLNERSTELAWQAWLLVDSTNLKAEPGVSRRRITPKSIFIAPTFSPDSLPPCPEGYRSDFMGRCVKIVRIEGPDKFELLLKDLSEKFADYEEEVEEEAETQQPFRVNIPLFDGGGDDGLLDNETADMAIVVAPTSIYDKSIKLDVKRNDNDKFNIENVAAILGVNPDELETTTLQELTTTLLPTTEEPTTLFTTSKDEEETTESATTTETSTRNNPDETTYQETTTSDATTVEPLLEGDAIFFKWQI